MDPQPLVRPQIILQPKQGDIFDIIEGNRSTWVGGGGGRGGAKSGCLQRCMLSRRLAWPGTLGAIVMRNSDQVRKYHENPMLRAWPLLDAYYGKTDRKIILPFKSGAPSEIEFTYAETLDDVIRRFRSANYFDIAIDQAEQFTEEELREIKQAVRWPDVPEGTCKLWLFFNMGGVGIDFLRKKFHTLEYNERENAKDFEFVHFYPYDNVEWSMPSLRSDGMTEEQRADIEAILRDQGMPREQWTERVMLSTLYYSWPEQKRIDFCANRSDYGKALVSQDEALVKRDFYGSWESLEGAFFARSFDRNKMVLPPEKIREIIKPWWERWLSQDWARGHFCVTQWHARGEMSPKEIKEHLGWDVQYPLKVVITYAEYIAGGEAAADSGGDRDLDEEDIAKRIVEYTPSHERDKMSDFFLSPDAFGKKSSKNTVAQIIGDVMEAHDMPAPRPADNERPGGWALMAKLMLATKRQGQRSDEVWLLSANCAQLIAAIPLAMRDPKNLDDILKTDKGAARIEMDAIDTCFVAGTMVLTRRGQIPIEQVMPGEYVATRSGWKLVRRAWLSSRSAQIVRAAFSDGTEITCTPNHRFATQRGFIPLDSVRYGDKLISWTSLNLTETFISSAGMDTTLAGRGSCTDRCGFKSLVASLPECTSTTKTMLRRARRILTTWSALIPSSMRPSTLPNVLPKPESTWLKHLSRLRTGTSPAPVLLGTGKTPRLAGLDKTRVALRDPAISVAVNFRALNNSGSARMPVSLSGGEITTSTLSKSPVSSAESLYSGTSTIRYEPAASSAVRLCGLETAGFADVYDLEVEDAHEFFANGILVHNCRYGLKSMLEPGRKPKEAEAEEKFRELQESGLDEHSLGIYRYRYSQESREADPPARFGRSRGIPVKRQ